MLHAIFINKTRAELVGDKFIRENSYVKEASVEPHYSRSELKGYKLKLKNGNAWEYLREGDLQ